MRVIGLPLIPTAGLHVSDTKALNKDTRRLLLDTLIAN